MSGWVDGGRLGEWMVDSEWIDGWMVDEWMGGLVDR